MKKCILIVALVLLTAGAVALWIHGRPAYRRYKETRSVAEAKSFLARADYSDASVSARKALLLNSNDLDACLIMAELSDRSHSPQLLEWRRRVADLAPTVQNRLALASVCLRTQSKPYSIAAQIIEDLAGTAADSAAYQDVAADLALRLGKPVEAAAHFEAAARLEPANPIHQVNLAVMRLSASDPSVVSAARATLEQSATNAQIGAIALRWLVSDALRHGDLPGAARYSAQLLANPQAELADKLDRLSILQRTKSPDFNSYLGSVQRDALTNASEVYTVTSWMLGHGIIEGAQQWLTNCPPNLSAEQPVPLAVVDCYVARKDWLGLDAFLVDKNWHDLDFLRYAYLSRASEEEQQQLAADARWRGAIRQADTQLGALSSLLNMARSWKRTEAEEDLLLQIGQYFQHERWAWRDLEQMYLASSNTLGLNKLYSLRSQYDSTNYVAQNNLAATSLLLKLNLPHAYDLARDVYQNHPDDPMIVSTYAYSLLLQGKTKAGLDAMEKLKPETLEQPAVALYYGVLLSDAGQKSAAARYLETAKKARLLPEEKALLAETLNPSPRKENPAP